ncbi:gluconokinase [Oxalobacteraceae bacterium CAVE-383]|nr:gluconokinase [Oxalobacteraceae bacterium CAVE-383]
MTKYMIGVDIGTTSTKAVVFTLTGEIVARHAVGYPLIATLPGMAEQAPLQIVDAVLETIGVAVRAAAASPDEIALVSFSAAMHSVIALDARNELLTNSITWADNRAAGWAKRLRQDFDGHAIYRRTGTPLHPMSPLCKLMWLRHDHADLFARAARFAGIKEYVFFRLFGRWLVDHSIASATGMFNLRSMEWDAEALKLAGVTAAHLSAPVPTTYCLRGLPPALARPLGLSVDTPFVIGANDGVLSNLGVNAIHRGQVAVTIGTSGAMRAMVERPYTDVSGRTFCYALDEDHWVVGGPVNNGGNVLQWVRDELAGAEAEIAREIGIDPYDALTELASRVPAGAEGLLFHPYLAGERAPLWNADLRGSFFGLALHHGKAHMVRAVLEGVIFNLLSILPAVEAVTGPAEHIVATGGFAHSALWRQIMADIFEREVVVPECVESSCLGAAVLGLHALKLIASLDAVGSMVGATHRHVPIAENAAVYARLRPIFMAIPRKLEQEYLLLAQFQLERG